MFELNFPAHWILRKMKYSFDEVSIKGYPNEPLLVASQTMGVVPKGIYGQRTVEATKDLHLLKLVEVGNFVISLRSFQGGIEYAYYRGIISPAYTILKSKGIYYEHYFKYFAKSAPFIGLLKTCVTGIREGQNIDYQTLKNKKLPVPPFDEQEKIVRYLDKKTSQMTKIIDAKSKQVELLEELKRSTISKAVTTGIFSDKTPDTWQKIKLSQLAIEQKISNKNIHHQNLLSLSYGKIKRKDINTHGGLLPASFDTYQIVNEGNIIMRLTDLQNDHKSLRVGIANETGIITSAYTCLKPIGEIFPKFLYYVLHSYDLMKIFYGLGSGVRQSIGWLEIRKLKISLPKLWEQKEIADYLDAKCARIEKLIEGLQLEIKLIEELRTRIISDAVTGKIDVRELI